MCSFVIAILIDVKTPSVVLRAPVWFAIVVNYIVVPVLVVSFLIKSFRFFINEKEGRK